MKNIYDINNKIEEINKEIKNIKIEIHDCIQYQEDKGTKVKE